MTRGVADGVAAPVAVGGDVAVFEGLEVGVGTSVTDAVCVAVNTVGGSVGGGVSVGVAVGGAVSVAIAVAVSVGLLGSGVGQPPSLVVGHLTRDRAAAAAPVLVGRPG
ncbi:hypothetical protein L6Q96_22890 [Candidatus Binatia bacterium]|nr:hypothetical protein [Candidatus Binatia bacterium]